ncbi:MAG TPA: ATPase [Candidatus Coprenecus pullistercoris]|nr:ATPase [Candidatus Coprenecus pullistercoris]
MIVVADSGSTSIDWRILEDDAPVRRVVSAGVNPVYQSVDEMERVFGDVLRQCAGAKGRLYFYGAGVVSERVTGAVREALSNVLPGFEVSVGSDLLAAAVASLGCRDGVAAILGTGSNSGLYLGGRIVRNIPAGGFILGDEGSGAWLGKRLLSDYIKGMLPEDLFSALKEESGPLDYAEIVENVYRSRMPSRYLASFSPFLKRHEEHEYVRLLLEDGFRTFMQRNVLGYGRKDLPLAVVGSVAVAYEDVLRSVASGFGIEVLGVEASAGDGLVRFYRNKDGI